MPLQELDQSLPTKKRIFLYGENGSGKTDLALSAPGKKLLIDWYGNVLEVAQRRYASELANGNIKIVPGPTKWADIDSMVKMPLDPLVEWCDVFVMDNLTGLYREVTEDVAKNVPLKNSSERTIPEVVILRDYGLAAERLRYIMGKVMDNIYTPSAPKKHIIAICHTKLEKDEKGNVVGGGPSLPGQVPAFVLSLFPEQIFLKCDSNQQRRAHFTQTGYYGAATRVLDGKPIDDPNLSKMYKW